MENQNWENKYTELLYQYNKDKEQWNKEKSDYQNLCQWYANSFRYRLGSLLLEDIKRPIKLFGFPFQMYQLYKEYKANANAEGLESNLTRKKQEHNIDWIEYNYSEKKDERTEEIKNIKRSNDKPRILYVMMEATGGSVKTNEDLMGYLSNKEYEVYLLSGNGQELKLYQCKEDVLILIKTFKLNKSWDINDVENTQFQDIYFDVLQNIKISLLHIRHFYMHQFTIVTIAKLFEIPVIVSFHDFYCICPTTNMIDDKRKYCNGQCKDKQGNCCVSLPNVKISGNVQKWVESKWRHTVWNYLDQCDLFITTSLYSRDLHIKFFPDMANRFRIIEHGRDFKYERQYLGDVPNSNQKIKIMIAGNIDYNKGDQYIQELIRLDVDKKIEWHCIGIISEELKKHVIYYGKYIRDDFNSYVEKIKPSYIGVFSMWPETYCHVLSEAWSCGIPCIVSDIGTLHERAMKGGAIFADLDSPEVTYERIINNAYDQNAYNQLCNEVQEQKLRSIDDMGNDYLHIYRNFLNKE